jgi:hypothetical protein
MIVSECFCQIGMQRQQIRQTLCMGTMFVVRLDFQKHSCDKDWAGQSKVNILHSAVYLSYFTYFEFYAYLAYLAYSAYLDFICIFCIFCIFCILCIYCIFCISATLFIQCYDFLLIVMCCQLLWYS